MTMKRSTTLLSSAALLAAFQSGPAAAVTIDYAVRSTLGFQADGDADFGQAPGGDRQNLFLNLAPRALIEFNPDWTGYVRARAFVPSGAIQPFDSSTPNNATARTRAFVGLSELWLQYNGLTSYPGEAISLGRQHIRQTGSEWFDEDADALRWNFNTTLTTFDVGAAHQFSSYRSDDAPVIAKQRHRTYVFGTVAMDWLPEHRIGFRAVHAIDSGSAPDVGSAVTADSKLQNSELTWAGVFADNGFYDARSRESLLYWAEFTYLIGSQDRSVPGAGNTVASRGHENVNAYAGTGGARWKPFETVPVSFGGLFTYSSGGETPGHSRQFQQTGLQSNASTFTGSLTLINRYNETLLAELGNLRVISGFTSLATEQNEISLIFSNFARVDGYSPIVTNNVNAVTVNNSTDIGNGIDLVATHYFGRLIRRQRLLDQGDAFVSQERRSLVSLRASAFEPGSAYGPNTKTDYRIVLEATLWLN